MQGDMRVVEHSSELGAWTMLFASPDPRLRGYVESYGGYREHGTAFYSRREMPGGSVVVLLNFGDPLRITDTVGDSLAFGECQGFVGALSDSYAVSETNGAQRGMHVMLTPFGARRLFGLPLHHLANRVVRLEDLLGSEIHALLHRLRETRDWAARFALLDDLLLRRLRDAKSLPRDLLWAWRQLADSQGNMPIADLAARLDCSRKHLAARFADEVGLGPKTIARIHRFQHAMGLISAADSVDWSDLALQAGYYDQAHLIREFRTLAGSAPGDFLRRRLPDHGGVIGDAGR